MKLGISSKRATSKYGVEKGLKLIKQSGFDTVDVSFTSYGKGEENDIYQKSEDEFLGYFYNFRKRCDELELEISQTHGRLTTCVPDEGEQASIKRISELDLKASQLLGSPVCVFHNAKLKQFEDVSIEGDFILEKNKEFFEGFLSPLCEKYNVKFALETHGRTMVHDKYVLDYLAEASNLLKSFDSIESDYKAICLDTGHCREANFYGAVTVEEAVKILGKKNRSFFVSPETIHSLISSKLLFLT